MKVFVLIFFVAFSAVCKLYGQDLIYTTSGLKIASKILEISPDGITYQLHHQQDTSVRFINKTEVVLVNYQNGVPEIFNANTVDVEPKKKNLLGSQKTKKAFDVHFMNKNVLSINALALANGDITLMYDRDILDNKLSLSVLGGYNFNSRMGGLNLFITDSKVNAKKLFDAGLGINYLFNNSKRVQYYVGVLGKYMAYQYQQVEDTMNNQNKYHLAQANQISLMLTNGCLFRVSPNFNLKLFCSIGKSINSVPLDKLNDKGEKVDYSNYPKIYLGYCFGYRF